MSSAVVTGAAMGIGRAVAERLVDDGHPRRRVRSQRDAPRGAREEIGAPPTSPSSATSATGTPTSAPPTLQRQPGTSATGSTTPASTGSEPAHEIDAAHIEQGLRVLQLGPMYGACVAVRRMLPARGGLDRQRLFDPGHRGIPSLLRLRLGEGRDPDADEDHRGGLRPVRDPVQRPPARGASRRR